MINIRSQSQDTNKFCPHPGAERERERERELYCIGSVQFFIESFRSSHTVRVLKVKAFGDLVLASVVYITSDLQQRDLRICHLILEIFLCSITSFAKEEEQSRQLLFEPYLDAVLHDVLLHLPSQIPDHMPYTDSFLVLLTLLPYRAGYTIYILNNNFLWQIKKGQSNNSQENFSTSSRRQVKAQLKHSSEKGRYLLYIVLIIFHDSI